MLKDTCLICYKEEVIYDDFMNEKQHEEMRLNEKSGIKYTRKTKIEFMEYFIRTKINSECKVILCSSYIRIFNDIKHLLNNYNIKYKELDDGNVNSISKSINDYNYGNINVLLLNSNLFGCGLNLQCTSDIVFLHKTESELEKQIIGRAQRIGRKNSLNIWYLMYQNEHVIYTKKNKIDDFDIIPFTVTNNTVINDNILINDNSNIAYYDSKFDNYMNIME
jgi:SNF2 family DNA or RNA helicase